MNLNEKEMEIFKKVFNLWRKVDDLNLKIAQSYSDYRKSSQLVFYQYMHHQNGKVPSEAELAHKEKEVDAEIAFERKLIEEEKEELKKLYQLLIKEHGEDEALKKEFKNYVTGIQESISRWDS